MKRWAVGFLFLLTGPAFAQMVEINPPAGTELIRLMPGQARTFQFEKPVQTYNEPIGGVVSIIPQSERSATFQGLREGQVLITARAADGSVVQRFQVSVGAGTVRIYHRNAKDFILYNCTDTGCGHGVGESVDKGVATTVSRPNGSGGWTTSTTTAN